MVARKHAPRASVITQRFFKLCAENGRLVLITGLLFGAFVPALAQMVQPYLQYIVGLLLFLNAFKIGWREATSSFSNVRETLLVLIALQLVLPICIALTANLAGINSPIVLAVIIMASAASIGGSPNITQLSGHAPAPALRLLILGTAILPLTAFIVFYLFSIGDVTTIFFVALKLLAVITLATGMGFVVRQKLLPQMSDEHYTVIDGASVLTMAALVIGLMSAMGPAFLKAPLTLVITLAAACIVNLGLQIATFYTLRSQRFAQSRVAVSVVAGNRNMALFLVALPPAMTEPLMLFIACYQVPMYLTPLLMSRIYKKD